MQIAFCPMVNTVGNENCQGWGGRILGQILDKWSFILLFLLSSSVFPALFLTAMSSSVGKACTFMWPHGKQWVWYWLTVLWADSKDSRLSVGFWELVISWAVIFFHRVQNAGSKYELMVCCEGWHWSATWELRRYCWVNEPEEQHSNV